MSILQTRGDTVEGNEARLRHVSGVVRLAVTGEHVAPPSSQAGWSNVLQAAQAQARLRLNGSFKLPAGIGRVHVPVKQNEPQQLVLPRMRARLSKDISDKDAARLQLPGIRRPRGTKPQARARVITALPKYEPNPEVAFHTEFSRADQRLADIKKSCEAAYTLFHGREDVASALEDIDRYVAQQHRVLVSIAKKQQAAVPRPEDKSPASALQYIESVKRLRDETAGLARRDDDMRSLLDGGGSDDAALIASMVLSGSDIQALRRASQLLARAEAQPLIQQVQVDMLTEQELADAKEDEQFIDELENYARTLSEGIQAYVRGGAKRIGPLSFTDFARLTVSVERNPQVRRYFHIALGLHETWEELTQEHEVHTLESVEASISETSDLGTSIAHEAQETLKRFASELAEAKGELANMKIAVDNLRTLEEATGCTVDILAEKWSTVSNERDVWNQKETELNRKLRDLELKQAAQFSDVAKQQLEEMEEKLKEAKLSEYFLVQEYSDLQADYQKAVTRAKGAEDAVRAAEERVRTAEAQTREVLQKQVEALQAARKTASEDRLKQEELFHKAIEQAKTNATDTLTKELIAQQERLLKEAEAKAAAAEEQTREAMQKQNESLRAAQAAAEVERNKQEELHQRAIKEVRANATDAQTKQLLAQQEELLKKAEARAKAAEEHMRVVLAQQTKLLTETQKSAEERIRNAEAQTKQVQDKQTNLLRDARKAADKEILEQREHYDNIIAQTSTDAEQKLTELRNELVTVEKERDNLNGLLHAQQVLAKYVDANTKRATDETIQNLQIAHGREIAILREHLFISQSNSTVATEALKAAENEVLKLRVEMATWEERRNLSQAAEGRLSALEHELRASTTKIQQLVKEAEISNKHVVDLEAKISHYEKTNQDLDHRVQNADIEIIKAKIDYDTLQRSLEQEKRNLQQINERSAKRHAGLTKTSSEYKEKLRVANNTINENKVQARTAQISHETEMTEVKTKLETSEAERERLQGQLNEFTERYATLENNNNAEKAKLSETVGKLTEEKMNLANTLDAQKVHHQKTTLDSERRFASNIAIMVADHNERLIALQQQQETALRGVQQVATAQANDADAAASVLERELGNSVTLIQGLRKENTELKTALAASAAATDATAATIRGLTKDIESKQQTLSQHDRRIKELDAQNASVQGLNDQQAVRIKELENLQKSAKAEAEAMKARVQETEGRLNASEQQVIKLNADVANAVSTWQAADAGARKASQDLERLKEEHTKTAQGQKEDIAKLQQALEKAKNDVDAGANRFQEETAKQKKDYEALQLLYDNLVTTHRALVIEHEKVQGAFSDLQRQLREGNEKQTLLREQLTSSVATIERLTSDAGDRRPLEEALLASQKAAAQVVELRAAYVKQLEDVQTENAAKIEDLSKKFSTREAKRTRRHKAETKKLQEAHAAKVEGLETDYKQRDADVKANHAQEMLAVQNRNAQLITQLGAAEGTRSGKLVELENRLKRRFEEYKVAQDLTHARRMKQLEERVAEFDKLSVWREKPYQHMYELSVSRERMAYELLRKTTEQLKDALKTLREKHQAFLKSSNEPASLYEFKMPVHDEEYYRYWTDRNWEGYVLPEVAFQIPAEWHHWGAAERNLTR